MKSTTKNFLVIGTTLTGIILSTANCIKQDLRTKDEQNTEYKTNQNHEEKTYRDEGWIGGIGL